MSKLKDKLTESPETSSKGDSLDSLLSQLVKQHNALQPKSAMFGEEELGSTVEIFIPTGSIALDTIISNKEVGGWPCGRIVELYGEQAYGKTSICFQAMANTQKMGGLAIFIDAENAASDELMKAYGVDTSKILYSNLDLVEDIFDALEKNLTVIASSETMKKKPTLVVIDSLAAIKSKKLVEGTYDYNMNTQGEFAKILGLALKRILPFLHKANACLIVINQLRDKLGVMGGDTKYTPGGNALKFYATLRLRLLGKKLITVKEHATGEDVAIGAEVSIRTDKNKLGPPQRRVDFQLDFSSGINEYNEWITYLTNLGYVTRGGSWYTITEKFPLPQYHNKKFQRSNFDEILEDPEAYETIKKVIIKGFIRNSDTNSIDIIEEKNPEITD
jgi:recombination protein RecA